MLVLSRRNRESVVVGDFTGYERILKVTVLEIADGEVKLGFDVAPDVSVHPMELWHRILDPMRKFRAVPQPPVA